MGKEDDLWDDSALINAFDAAISKYKKMHGKGHHDESIEEGKITSSSKESSLAVKDESKAIERHIKADGESIIASDMRAETGKDTDAPPVQENRSVNVCALEPCVDSSSGQHQAVQGYSNAQSLENYNQLLNQYYVLEEQRQNILQQLHQYDTSNYQNSGSNLQWGACSVSQEHQLPTAQASYPAISCTCCPYVSQCLSGQCSLVCNNYDATSALGCDQKSISIENGDLIKTAMGAAERAFSSLKMKISSDATVLDYKNEETNEGEMSKVTSSDTDLSSVLNAWYSAGFYTGKYLVEQNIAKRRHG